MFSGILGTYCAESMAQVDVRYTPINGSLTIEGKR